METCIILKNKKVKRIYMGGKMWPTNFVFPEMLARYSLLLPQEMFLGKV